VLADLVRLGYDINVAKKALLMCNNELNYALDFITEQ
jgi:hypothetical protein